MHGLILFCTLVAIGAHSTAFVKVKGRDEFDAAMESSRFVLALFSSKWCGRICHMAARAIQRAAKQLPSDLAPIYHQSGVDDLDALDEPDDALVLLKVDGGQRVNEEVLIREGVHDYPAIHFYIRGYKHV
ncbi:hypothetical protein Pmar_PMAR009554 [Perkinsus marinus ATCC 50983]|uniref:Thioredoxin domain-containing protein n=1 Tax=Perkinsus marinus (strain ATCC 50983 / TXsc) TaxID=423536 RepID=C5KEI1_PERM5|nr:hypothetical protein Pmar_PMAR009554 [Perkinsus marinus ATCC 50983]EER17119.1 hypothetical protein Pmar_PMAR009554 [Perkinsus marinus ATCC 50983]|eukprot:XP_002785323.1 hypothetical protein Pmar_PMAR009554 [Perkinsus marinus ATCC 50983]